MTMDLNMETIKDIYAKLGISVDQESEKAVLDFWSQKSELPQFGIYTEGGFNFSSNTNFNAKQK